MSDTKILDLMVRDHEKIDALIHNLKNTNADLDSVRQAFDEFKWVFEKHLFTEERTIFTFYNPKQDDYDSVPEMLKDHEALLDFLRGMENDLQSGKTINLHAFEELLEKHRVFEERTFYPRLDEQLSLQHKRIIINRIK